MTVRTVVAALCVLAVGVYARRYLSGLGSNADVQVYFWGRCRETIWAWPVVSEVGYGPLAAYLFCPVAWLSDSMAQFHVRWASALTLVDIATAVMLWRVRGLIAATLFFLCPIVLLLTGYHSSTEPLAACFGLAGWLLYCQWSSPRTALLAGLVLACSLSAKPAFMFFPLLLFIDRERPLWHWAVCCFVAYGGFLLCLKLAGSLSILAHREGGWYGNSLLPQFLPEPSWMVAWALGATIVPLAIASRRPRALLAAYLMAFVAFTPALAVQHLYLPVLALAFCPLNVGLWAFVVVGTVILLSSPDNVHWIQPTFVGQLVPRHLSTSSLWPHVCLLAALPLTLRRKDWQ